MPILNKLKSEKSAYLLQHATNPINWYAWGEEPFQKAKEENKPILVRQNKSLLKKLPNRSQHKSHKKILMLKAIMAKTKNKAKSQDREEKS